MSFENKTTAALLKVAAAGLGFTLDVNALPAEDIERIKAAARQSGAHITFVDSVTTAASEAGHHPAKSAP